MQTRKRSLIESASAQVLGLAYAIPLNWVMYTQIQWTGPWIYATVNTLMFMAAGIVFKYVLRRFFNWLDEAHPVN